MKKYYVSINLMKSEKWRQFLESTALALHINLVFFSDGVEEQFSALYECPNCGCGSHPSNDSAATNISIMTPVLDPASRESEIIRLDEKYSVAVTSYCCGGVGNTSEVFEKVSIVKDLLTSFYNLLTEQLCEAQYLHALSTLHQTNRTIQAMFQRDDDALTRVIDLILSAAIIVFNTEGSWVAYQMDDQQRYQTKGNCVFTSDNADDFENKSFSVEICNPVLYGTFGVLLPFDLQRTKRFLEFFVRETLALFENDNHLKNLGSNLFLIVDAVDNLVLFVDKKMTISFANKTATELLNRSLQELVLLSINEIDAPWRDCITAQTVKATKGSMDLLNCASGESYIDWAVYPLAEDLDIQGWVIIATDCTDVNRLQELGGRIENLVNTSTMLNVIAHEIRNPLATFKGLLHLIDMKSGIPEISKYVNLGLDEIKKLIRLLDDCTQLGRTATISREETDLNLFMEEFTALATAGFQGPDIEIVTAFNDVVPIMADKRQLTQAVLNLVKNAYEAFVQKGKITLRLKQIEKEWAEIQVCDNGPGIPDTIKEHMFKPYYSTKADGTGLGLAITRAIINNHNGSIAAYNLAEGGACFSIRLPIKVKTRDQKLSYVSALIVTNDDSLRLPAERLFKVANVNFYSIKKYDSIILKIDRNKPHLIFIDEDYLNINILYKMLDNITAKHPDIKILIAGDRLQIAKNHIFNIPKPLNDQKFIDLVKSLIV